MSHGALGLSAVLCGALGKLCVQLGELEVSIPWWPGLAPLWYLHEPKVSRQFPQMQTALSLTPGSRRSFGLDPLDIWHRVQEPACWVLSHCVRTQALLIPLVHFHWLWCTSLPRGGCGWLAESLVSPAAGFKGSV